MPASIRGAYITEGIDHPVDPLEISELYTKYPTLYGWQCDVCNVGHEPFYTNRELALIVLRNHCKGRDHRTNASSPTRFK